MLEAFFFTVSGFASAGFRRGTYPLRPSHQGLGATGSIARGLLPALREIMTHERFWACDKRNWSLGHLLTIWGFAGFAVVGTVTGIGTMVGILRTPLALTSGLKILANASALVILGGSLILLFERSRDPVKRAASAYFDWFFLLTLVGVVVDRDTRGTDAAGPVRRDDVPSLFCAPCTDLRALSLRALLQVRAPGLSNGGRGRCRTLETEGSDDSAGE